MPCSSEGFEPSDDQIRRQMYQALNLATRVACTALKELEQTGGLHRLDQEALEWFEQHKKEDAQRIRREALNKLTDDEKTVLGLNKQESETE